ncbi:MAG: IgGFc-binding protein [Bacteroidetes bacterium]|nr:IgGFc-binding protein [Bacteroidota bacterium]
MYCIPTVGWGTSYVVAGYEAYLLDPSIADLPSEFIVVASQDNTNIQITPTWDIRQDGFPSVVAHPKGQTFNVTLNRGECMQFQSVTPNPGDDPDLTGTIVVGDKPVGMIGGSVCPNIPAPDPACDHVLDMMQPIRTWSNHYFSVPFRGRQYGGDLFLVVGTKPGQVIFRNGNQAAILTSAFDHFWIYDITEASEWTSDTAFQLVQYIESANHLAPSSQKKNVGDPASVVVNPIDQFGSRIIFQIPQLGGTLGNGEPDFTNYVNFILPASHESKTTMDGRQLNAIPGTSIKRFPFGASGWEAIQLSYTTAGAGGGNHVVASDTGVGVYLYGYTDYDSYAWAGALGIRSANSLDTLPPIADTTGACFCAHISVRDDRTGDSKLNSIVIDSAFNMTFNRDANFIDGVGTSQSYYDICVTDSSQEAYVSVTSFDLAGNATTVVSTFKPSTVDFEPCPFVLSSPSVGVAVYGYDTLVNTGSFSDNAYSFIGTNLKLLRGNQGFVIDSVGADGLIPPGGKRIIKIKFTAPVATGVSDTIEIFDGCQYARCTLLGSGGAAEFNVPPIHFDCIIPDSTGYLTKCQIINTSSGSIQVTSITLDDNVHFKFDPTLPGNSLPITVPGTGTLGGVATVTFSCTPTAVGPVSTTAHFISPSVTGERTATVDGKGCAPMIVSTPDTVKTDCNNPITLHVKFQNVGNFPDSLVAITHSDKAHFQTPTLEDGFGKVYTLPMRVDESQTIVADVLYSPPARTSDCFTDTIFLVSVYGDTIRGYANVCDIYRDAQLSRGTVNLNTVAVGGSVIIDSFIVCNNGKDPLTVSRIDKFLSKDSSQFQLTGVMKLTGGTPATFPVTVPVGGCLTIYVQFDPALLDNAQEGDFGIITDACVQAHQNLAVSITATTSVGPPTIKGFTTKTILSCASTVDSVTVTNSQPVPKQIVGVNVAQPAAGSFTPAVTLPVAITIPPNSSVKVPVTFAPVPSTTPAYYAGYLTASVIDIGQTDTVLISDSVRGTASYFDLSFNHSFTKPIVHANDNTSMPIALALSKNGLSEPLSMLAIEKVVLTYTYDIDLLNIVNKATMFTSAIPGWKIDTANSGLDVTNKILTLTLVGPKTPLTETMTSLGSVNFQVALTKSSNSTTVNLTSSTLYDSLGAQVPGCMVYAHQDTSVTLVLECGDSTLRKYMIDGVPPVRIIPAVPNPVTGTSHSVALSYSQRVEGEVSLSVFDPLGKEVARLLDHAHHPAGTFQVLFDTDDLPAGSYVYRVDFGARGVRSGRFVIER